MPFYLGALRRGVASQSKLRGLNRLELLKLPAKSLNFRFLLGFDTLSCSSCGALTQVVGAQAHTTEYETTPLALRMLNIATGYSTNTLSCSELNREHAGEGFRPLRHILTELWACKSEKCQFSRKFRLWPDLTRSNVDLGIKTIYAIARSCRGASTGFFPEALRPSGADRQGGRPPWPSALWEMPWPDEG